MRMVFHVIVLLAKFMKLLILMKMMISTLLMISGKKTLHTALSMGGLQGIGK